MAYKEIHGWCDQNGEFHECGGEGIPVFVGRKRRSTSKLYFRWAAVNLDANLTLARDKDIRLIHHRVIQYLVGILDFDNFVSVHVPTIARELDVNLSETYKAIRLLETKGVIIPGPKVPGLPNYRFNPYYGYRGDPTGKVYKTKLGEIKLVDPQSRPQTK